MVQFSVSQFGPVLAACTRRKGNSMIGQAFSVYSRRIFDLPMEEYSYIVFDAFVKSPSFLLLRPFRCSQRQ